MTLCESSIQTSTNTTILSTVTYIEYYAPCNNQHSYIFEKNESIYSKRFVLEVLLLTVLSLDCNEDYVDIYIG